MHSSSHNKRIVIIAGPNGAGKTSFAREFLPTDAALPNFVNADLIAAGLSPFVPDLAAFKAGRSCWRRLRIMQNAAKANGPASQ